MPSSASARAPPPHAITVWGASHMSCGAVRHTAAAGGRLCAVADTEGADQPGARASTGRNTMRPLAPVPAHDNRTPPIPKLAPNLTQGRSRGRQRGTRSRT